ncbi:sulfite exporter TauE/SafE family protein [Paracoccus sp. p4-l81]|uniref:sulfite exporter TauE/SafE family protein n=1 Tax=unclassified Paracoccus (in: a-proteobacteria) TaxID=2688777 RepID=UPI0035B6B724
MGDSFLLFALVGFLAQLVDGALGMAYGVVSSTVMLSFGVSPAVASATVHAAEVFTTGASAASHIAHRNVDWRLFRRLVPAGVIGGLIGTYVLTSFDGAVLRPWVVGYLGLMGVYILYRSNHRPDPYHEHSRAAVVGLGSTGGFVDAVGGGGWGPVVTTGLIGAGGAPRQVIGTVNAAEFLLTVAVSAGFLIALLTGHWDQEKALVDHAMAVAGLVAGGVLAAPLAGYVTRILPHRVAMVLVGLLICTLAAYQLLRLL